MNFLSIIVSGHICRPQGCDLRPFWRGFIELQRKLPTDTVIGGIYAHSWNPEFATLIDIVYGPTSSQNERQPYFYSEFINDINPPDFFEAGLDRLKSTWKNVSFQSILGNLRSRCRALSLMQGSLGEGPQGRILMTRWDLGQTGSKQVNQLVLDFALPRELIYMAYFSEVDEGYADMWIVAPAELANVFRTIDVFALECLTGKNDYVEMFTKTGWPHSQNPSSLDMMMSNPIAQRARSIALESLKFLSGRFCGGGFVHRIIRRAIGKPLDFLRVPPTTAENSFIESKKKNRRIFPRYQALNIHAILKHFIFAHGLREKTRFLSHDDFDSSMCSGKLIKPQAFVLFFWDLDLSDKQAIRQLLVDSPLPIAAIYVLNDMLVTELYINSDGEFILSQLKAKHGGQCDRLASAIDVAVGKSWGSLPCLILPSMREYLECGDWFYLNALLKYIVWSGVGYVGISQGQRGRAYIEFPNIEVLRGGQAFSLYKALGLMGNLRQLINKTDMSLDELSFNAGGLNLEFPCIVSDRRIF